MHQKLYRVEVVLYVMAEDEFEACWAATEAPFDVFECVAKVAGSVEPEWQEAVPYHSDDDRTCAEIMASARLAAPAGVKTVKPPSCWTANAAAPSRAGRRRAQPQYQP